MHKYENDQYPVFVYNQIIGSFVVKHIFLVIGMYLFKQEIEHVKLTINVA